MNGWVESLWIEWWELQSYLTPSFVNMGTDPSVQEATQLLHSRARTLSLFTQFPASLLPLQCALWVTFSCSCGKNTDFRVMKARILSVDFPYNSAWLFLGRVYLCNKSGHGGACMSVLSVLRRPWQEAYKFEVFLGYLVRPYLKINKG